MLNRMDQMEKTDDKKKYFVVRERAVPEVLSEGGTGKAAAGLR